MTYCEGLCVDTGLLWAALHPGGQAVPSALANAGSNLEGTAAVDSSRLYAMHDKLGDI